MNALIDNKTFFAQPVEDWQEVYEKHIEMSINDDYTTKNVLDFSNHQNYCKIIIINY